MGWNPHILIGGCGVEKSAGSAFVTQRANKKHLILATSVKMQSCRSAAFSSSTSQARPVAVSRARTLVVMNVQDVKGVVVSTAMDRTIVVAVVRRGGLGTFALSQMSISRPCPECVPPCARRSALKSTPR
jgi:hypothetical protein